MGGGDLGLARRAGEDEIVAVDDGGAADERDGARRRRWRRPLPQSTATAVSAAVGGVGSWATYLPPTVILPSTVPGSSRRCRW